MGKTFKYVKEFDFSPAGKPVGCSMGDKKGYAVGGMHKDVKADKSMVKTAVHKHEKAMHKGEPLTKLAKGGMKPEVRSMSKREMMATPTMEKKEVVQKESVKAPSSPLGMIRDNSKLGIKGNKNPGIARRRMPVTPREPMIQPYKSGGLMSEKGSKKVEKVMSEYKSGTLHSGSKTGPVVKNPKQAVAIALSEGRNVGKKKS